MSKKATKVQINKILKDAGSYNYKVRAQGSVEVVKYSARNRNAMGFCDRTKTVITPNGRFRVVMWGKNLDARIQTIIKNIKSAGFIVENVTNDSFEVHNGLVLDVKEIVRWEGSI